MTTLEDRIREMTLVCIVCGRPIKGGSKMVHYRTDNIVFGPDWESEFTPRTDQGFFEVGPDCYRLVVAAGRGGFRIGG